MNNWANRLFTLLLALPALTGLAHDHPSEGKIELAYSDGRPALITLKEINNELRRIGVRVETIALPEAAKPLLAISQSRALKPEETTQLLGHFSLHRGELLDIIHQAGRKPEAHRGGYLSTSETGRAPYPKVYDMKALTPKIINDLQVKFGKLHVNSSENGMGIDEVMTLVAGGDWKWFFVLPGNVTGKLTLGHVGLNGTGWRISYPGLVPHGGYLDPEHGLVIAHAHGPEKFVMRYADPSVKGSQTLGKNDWIDLTTYPPVLLD